MQNQFTYSPVSPLKVQGLLFCLLSVSSVFGAMIMICSKQPEFAGSTDMTLSLCCLCFLSQVRLSRFVCSHLARV